MTINIERGVVYIERVLINIERGMVYKQGKFESVFYLSNQKYLDHLDEVDKENIFVLVTEPIDVIVDHPGIMMNSKPSFQTLTAIQPKQTHTHTHTHTPTKLAVQC